MASYNRVILMGNLTRDPQLRYLPSNTAVCDFGLATNRRWRDQEGNQREEVCFVDIEVFGKQAEVVNQYMAKGRPILVEGHLRFESWTGQDGQKRSKHRVVAEKFQFVGSREQGQGGGGAPYNRSAPPQDSGPHPGPAGQGPNSVPPTGDEIPF